MPLPPAPHLSSIPLSDEAATAALARRIAAAVEPGDLIALRGPLGIGKSVFARAFIRSLAGADEEVPSPTFTLVQSYDTPRGTIWHFDLYRLDDPADLQELGFDDAGRYLAVLVEWPERAGNLLPARRLDLTLAEGDTAQSRIADLAAVGGTTLASRAGLDAIR